MRIAPLLTLLSILALASPLTAPALAVEIAPRITDREIVERLTRLEEGQRFLLQYIDQRFDDQSRRFDDMSQRITQLHQTMLTLFGSLIVLISTLFGYIIWDRRTMFRPLKAKQEEMEQKLDRLIGIVENSREPTRDADQPRSARPERTQADGSDPEPPIVSGAARA